MCHTEALINLLMILDAQVNTGRIKLHPVCIGHWVWTGGGGGGAGGGGGRPEGTEREEEGGGKGRGRAVASPQWTLTIVVYYGPEQWRRHVIWLNPAGVHDICMAQPPSPTKLSYPPPPHPPYNLLQGGRSPIPEMAATGGREQVASRRRREECVSSSE